MRLIHELIRDEQGGEVLEYALIAGLIVVAALSVIMTVGTKVTAKWQSLDSGMYRGEPPPCAALTRPRNERTEREGSHWRPTGC